MGQKVLEKYDMGREGGGDIKVEDGWKRLSETFEGY